MKRHMRLTFFCSVFCSAVFLASSADPSTSAITPEKLKEILGNVARWPDNYGYTNYSAADRRALISAAKLIQSIDSESMQKALIEFQKRREGAASRRDDDSKLLLLMRVVFALPEGTKIVGHRPGFGGWLVDPLAKERWRTNAAWPISWQEGAPVLVDGYRGLEGKRYNAAEEFSHFRANYAFRVLSAQ